MRPHNVFLQTDGFAGVDPNVRQTPETRGDPIDGAARGDGAFHDISCLSDAGTSRFGKLYRLGPRGDVPDVVER
jgi:hypothetical protein